MELISIWYLSSLKQFVCSERASEVSVVLQRRFQWVFPGPFSLGNCTVNCTTQTEGILRGKAAFNSLMSCRSVSFEFSFWEGKTRFTHANAVNKRANSHNFKIKKIWISLQLLSLPFTYWTEVNLRTSINRRREWIILSVRSLTIF